MSKPKLTPWFNGREHQPLADRPGVYRRKYGHGLRGLYCRWDGAQWYFPAPTVELALQVKTLSLRQFLPWRGVTK